MPDLVDRQKSPAVAFLELGFRPFFAAAGLFAIVAVALWVLLFVFGIPATGQALAPVAWHGHQMVFGYALAVIAGFLLTAVVNWTGQMTLRGLPLAVLFVAWLAARLALLLPVDGGLWIAAVADLVFMGVLLVGITRPVLATRQWKQVGILSKVLLMLVANLVFYAGALGLLEHGQTWGLYAGLYLVLSLILVLGRRVMPFFIERGVGGGVRLRNRAWIDRSSLVLFTVWALLDVFANQPQVVAWLSLVLFAIHAVRLWDWHTPGIWRRPLLWSLYLGYACLLLGFLLKALAIWRGLGATFALHAFAFGSVGLVTLSMMARVTLGHTGRDVLDPPRFLGAVFAIFLVGALVRVLTPWLAPQYYQVSIAVAGLLWIAAFVAFVIAFLPMLARPRVDGQRG